MIDGMVKECAKIAKVIMKTSNVEITGEAKHALIPYESGNSDKTFWYRMRDEVMKKEIRIINNSQRDLSEVPTAEVIVVKNALKLALKHCQACNGPDDGKEFFCMTSEVLDKLNINF